MSLVLGLLWAWDLYEKVLVSYFSKKYKPVPLPEVPTYSPSDVSIVVPTIDTGSCFTECMRLWLRSNPCEIIIVTVPKCKARVEQLVAPVLTGTITILTVPLANKRQQLMAGAKAASGRIIALVDDDAYWRTTTVMPYLLAPFENPEIGLVAGLQSPEIPSERQDANVITVWEAAATLDMYRMNHDQPVRFAADEGCWVLVGRTVFVRAGIIQDQHFVDAFTHQVVNNKIVNGADDVYLTGWVLDHDWKICVQNAPEAEITTEIKRDWKKHPYLTRKLLEKLTRPLWASVAAFMLWMVFGWGGWVSGYAAFVRRYPYMASKVWALFLMESMGPIIDVYAFFTMHDDSWLTRRADDQYVMDAAKKVLQGDVSELGWTATQRVGIESWQSKP
uniref:Uncharacterized protein n=1 Tax=Talaromyces marneffei PM1 TaxID=1077442 RepID=A0A093V5P2_TALMA